MTNIYPYIHIYQDRSIDRLTQKKIFLCLEVFLIIDSLPSYNTNRVLMSLRQEEAIAKVVKNIGGTVFVTQPAKSVESTFTNLFLEKSHC